MKAKILLLFLVLGGIALWRMNRSAPTGSSAAVPAVPSENQPLASLPGSAPNAPAPAISSASGNNPAPQRGVVPPPSPTPLANGGGAIMVPPPLAGAPEVSEREAALSDGENVRLMLRDFRTVIGENPVGSNAEIMKAVMGGNQKQAKLGPPAGQNLNGDGELVDRWGTAYFFHQMSGTQMEIRSAGPDRKLYTSDDVISR